MCVTGSSVRRCAEETGREGEEENLSRGASFFLFKAEDALRLLVRSRGPGKLNRGQVQVGGDFNFLRPMNLQSPPRSPPPPHRPAPVRLLYTIDAAADPPCVEPRGRRIHTKKKTNEHRPCAAKHQTVAFIHLTRPPTIPMYIQVLYA